MTKAISLIHWAFIDISKYFADGFPDRPKFDGTFLVLQSRATERTQRLEAARQKLNSVLYSIQGDARLAAYSVINKIKVPNGFRCGVLAEFKVDSLWCYKISCDETSCYDGLKEYDAVVNYSEGRMIPCQL